MSRQLSWSHFSALLPLSQPFQQEFYAEMARIEGWSVRTLRARIDSMLYERTALSKQPDAMIRQELVAGVHESALGIRKNEGFRRRVRTLLLPQPQIVRQFLRQVYRRRVLHKLEKDLELPKLTFQVIRRTIATLAQKKGTVKDVQGLPRHSRAATTIDVYMQEIPESVQATVNAINAELRVKREEIRADF